MWSTVRSDGSPKNTRKQHTHTAERAPHWRNRDRTMPRMCSPLLSGCCVAMVAAVVVAADQLPIQLAYKYPSFARASSVVCRISTRIKQHRVAHTRESTSGDNRKGNACRALIDCEFVDFLSISVSSRTWIGERGSHSAWLNQQMNARLASFFVRVLYLLSASFFSCVYMLIIVSTWRVSPCK